MSASAPAITRIVYQSGVITLNWVMPGAGPTTAFQVAILDVSTGQTTTYPATGFNAAINQQLTPGVAYTATVTQVGGASSTAVPVITVSPQVTLVQNTGSGLILQWTAAGTYTRYSAVLQQLGQKSSTQSVVADTCTFNIPLMGSNWSTSVAAQTDDGISTGPVAQAYDPILVAPTMIKVQNTGSGLQLVWSLPGYTMFQASLQAAGAQPSTQVVIGNQYLFAGALTASAYTTWLAAQSTDGVLVGPPTAAFTPILDQPTMTSVENTGAGLNLTWQQVGTWSSYTATLQQLGKASSNLTVRALTCLFSGTLQGPGWSTAVAAQSDDGVLVGPPSTAYAPIIDQPSLTMLDYITGRFTANWQQVSDPSVAGYVVQITPSGGQGTPYPVGDVNTTSILLTLQPTTYSVVVRATNGIVLGPWSAAVVPLTAAPGSMRLGFDGTNLVASWTAPKQSGVTGYIATLLRDGAVLETGTPSQPQQKFASGMQVASVFIATSRATSANGRGPWSTYANGPYLAQRTYGYDSWGRLQSVAWASAKTQTYAVDSAGNIQSVTFTNT